jgi:hypothetical protein
MSDRRIDKPPASAAALQILYEQAIRRRDAGRAATSRVEALMHSLRTRRVAALTEGETRERIRDLSRQQFIEVCDRLQKLKPEIFQPWNDQEVEQLIITRQNVNTRRD